jgi:hypothetical protein
MRKNNNKLKNLKKSAILYFNILKINLIIIIKGNLYNINILNIKIKIIFI